MKKSKKSKLNIILSVIAAVLLAALIAYAVHLAYGLSIAYADEPARFEITADGSGSFELFKVDGASKAKIDGRTGSFFNAADNDSAISVIFFNAIKSEMGEAPYTVSFQFPDIATTVSNASFKYTESSGGALIKTDYALRGEDYNPIISEAISENLQYRKTDAEDYINYANSSESAGGLLFGRLVDVGSYYVRYVIEEIFTFAEVQYRVPRYGAEHLCTVSKADAKVPEQEIVNINYGTTVGQIAGTLSKTEGIWSLSEGEDGEELLHVKDGVYSVSFDFAPHNKNYNDKKGVILKIRVIPQTVRVIISDVFRLAGEDKLTVFDHEVVSVLVGDDTEDDLDLTFITDGVDVDTPGRYVVKAESRNPDYTVYSMNTSNMFIEGGLYVVYARSVDVTAPDGTGFTVLLGSGFKDISLKVELCDYLQSAPDELRLIGGKAYRFIFEDIDGVRVYPDETFTVTWEEGVLDSAISYATVLSDGFKSQIKALVGRYVNVEGCTDTIAFFESYVAPKDESPLLIASAVIGGISCALLLTLAVLLCVYFTRRRYFK